MSAWLPENVSTFGPDVDRLFYIIYYITLVSCAAVLAAMLYIIIRYRAREGGKATYNHGNMTLEIIWTLVPAAVFVMIGVMSSSAWSSIKADPPPVDYTVMVEGSQFNWKMTYPGLDGQFGTADDYSQENLLRTPVNKKMKIVLVAKDVIHSFFVPQLRLKQDAVPGREIIVWFEAIKEGNYEIPCAELCGFGHSNMKGFLRVISQEEFDTWARDKGAFPAGGQS